MSNIRQNARQRAEANAGNTNTSDMQPYITYSETYPKFMPKIAMDVTARITGYLSSPGLKKHPDPYIEITDNPFDLKGIPKYCKPVEDNSLVSHRVWGVHWCDINDTGKSVPKICKRIHNGEKCALCSKLFDYRKQRGVLSKTNKKGTDEYKNLVKMCDVFAPTIYAGFVTEILKIEIAGKVIPEEGWGEYGAQRFVTLADKQTKILRPIKLRLNKVATKNPDILYFSDFNTETENGEVAGHDVVLEFDMAGEIGFRHIAVTNVSFEKREALDDSILDSDDYPRLDDMFNIESDEEIQRVCDTLLSNMTAYNDSDDSGSFEDVPDTNSVKQTSVPQSSVDDIDEDKVKQMMEASAVTVEVDEPKSEAKSSKQSKVKPATKTTSKTKASKTKASKSDKVDDEWANM